MSLLLALTGTPGGTQTLTVPLISSTEQVFTPGIVQVVAAASIASTATTFAPTLANTNTLTPGLIASTAATFAPALTNTNTLTVGFIASTESVFVPTVANVTTLSASFIASTANVFAPTLTNTNTLSASFIASTANVFAPALTNTNTLSASFIASGEVVFAPTLANTNTLTPGLIASTAATFAPVLTNTNTLTVGFIASTESVFVPTLSQVSSLLVPLIASTEAVFAPTLANTNTLTPGLIASTAATFAPTLANTNTLSASFIASTANVFASSVQSIIGAPLIASTATTFAPVLTNTNTLTVGFIASTESVFVPTLSQVLALTAPLIASTATTFAPVLTNTNTLTVGFIASTVSVFVPTVANATTLSASFIASGEVVFAPTLANTNTLTPGLIASTAATFAPVLQSILVVPAITSASTVFGPNVQSVLGISTGIGSTAATFAPTLTNTNTLTASFIASTANVFAPALTNTDTLAVPAIASTESVFVPSVSASNTVIIPVISGTSQVYTPSVAEVLAFPAIPATDQVFAPTAFRSNTLNPSFLAPGSQIFTPFVSLDVRDIHPPTIVSGEIFAPIVGIGPGPIPVILGSKNIGPLGGQVVLPSGTGVVVPKGALKTLAPIEVRRVYRQTKLKVQAVSDMYEFGLEGQVFDIPVKITLEILPDRLPVGYTINDVTIRRAARKGLAFEVLPTRVLDSTHVEVETNHFSIFVATLAPLPLVKNLELPLPETLTKIVGIHQSDVVIRSAIEIGLADLRANPNLLDYVFASLPQDTITWKDYGESDVQQAKKWFTTTHIPVSVLPRLNESIWPQITIELLESSEVTPEATLGDVNYDPEEKSDVSWPPLTPKFTPKSYNASTGTITLAQEPEAWVGKGMFIVDRQGQAHEIIESIDSTSFKINPLTVADFRGAVIKGHRPNWNISVESSSFKETYRIGVHVSGEPIHLTWLHSILQFCLLRYKQVLMEARGFERSTLASTQISLDQRFEAENILSRYINVSGYVRQFWPKTIARSIDGIEMDALQVSGQNADVTVVTAGIDPSEALWVGNLDRARRIK